MNILTALDITKSYTERKMFEKASFFLQEGEKVGVIGINGTGKSTLLKMIAGQEEPDEGSIILANSTVIHYLPQNPTFNPEDNVLEAIDKMAAHHALGNEEIEAKTMLTKLGITDFSQKTKEMSGGQKKRLALVAVLLTPADLLILDEPTNHLDAQMAEWLEEKLSRFRGAIIMVTHDRYFLDSVTDRIIEIDQGSIYSYQENYSGFLIKKAEREERNQASERKRTSILRKEIAWMQRGAKARSTKQKAHIKRYEELSAKEGIAIQAQVELASISSRMGKTTIELSHLSKRYNDLVLLKDFSYIFLKHDRIGFVGSNGCGKSTLMKMIEGLIQPDEGTITIGTTIKIGYFAQEFDENNQHAGIAYMNPSLKVIDYIKNTAEFVRTQEGLVSASVMLERFLFLPSSQYSLIGTLSGGERRRLNLLRILMEAPNVLILDEPTNDLDIETMTILEDYLDTFDGIVMMVSHDRYFLDRVARRIFSFEGEGVIKQYEGGFTDYDFKKKNQGNEQGEQSSTGTKTSNNPISEKKESIEQVSLSHQTRGHAKKLKFSFNEAREYEGIEEEILELETKIEDIDKAILSAATDFGKLNAFTQEKDQLEEILFEKMQRWEYLEERATQIRTQEENS